jgi:hypothetical protein
MLDKPSVSCVSVAIVYVSMGIFYTSSVAVALFCIIEFSIPQALDNVQDYRVGK